MTEQEIKFKNSIIRKITEYSIPVTFKETISKYSNKFAEIKYNDNTKEVIDTGIEWFLCSKSASYFINNYCYISVPNLGIIPFKLYYFQKSMLNELPIFRKYVTLKTRQCGVSTVSAFYCLWRALFRTSESIAVVSKNLKAAQDFVAKIKVTLDMLPTFLNLKLETENKSSLVFINKSEIKSEARSPNAGRSSTLSLLVLDEVAFYGSENMAYQIVASAQPTLTRTGGGIIVISCYTKDTWINTENGLEKIEDYIPENCFLGYNKINTFKIDGLNHQQETNTFYDSGVTPIKEITLRNKTKIKVSNIHPLYILGDDGFPVWKQAKDIKIGDKALFSMREKSFGNNDYIGFDWCSVDNRKKYNIENFNGYIDEEMAYFFGLLIGDGYFNENGQYVCIINTDKEVVDFIYNNKHFKEFYCENRKDNVCHYRIHGKYLIELLRHIGFKKAKAKEKIIPKRLLSMSKENIRALLQGLFDSDGHSRSNRGEVGFTSTSPMLLEQIKMLLSMFGILTGQEQWVVSLPTKKSKVESLSGRIYLSSYFSKLFFEKIGFKIKRKQDAYSNVKNVVSKISYTNLGTTLRKSYSHIDLANTYSRNIRKGWKKISKTLRKNANPQSVKYYIDYFDGILNENETYKKTVDFYEKEFVPIEIVDIKDGEEHTYDFVIPETRSLYANTIIGSNTPNGTSGPGKYYYEQIQQLKVNGNSKEEKLLEIDWFEVPDIKGIFPQKGYNSKLQEFIEKDYFNNNELRKDLKTFFKPIEDRWKENEWLKAQHNTLGDTLFRQEILHDFVIMGNSVFGSETMERVRQKVKDPLSIDKLGNSIIKGFWIWEHPKPKHRYIISCDISKGTGKDSSCIQVIDAEHYEQVAEYLGFCSTPEFSRVIKKIANYYNQGFVIIESNGIGEAVFNGVYSDSQDPYNNVYKQKITRNGITVMTGWTTTQQTRQLITNNLIDWFSVDELWEEFKIYSSRVYAQMGTWIWSSTGRPDHADSSHDDALMALAIGLYNRDKAINAGQSFLVAEDGKMIDYSVNDPLTVKNDKDNSWNFVTSEDEETTVEKLQNQLGCSLEQYDWLIGK